MATDFLWNSTRKLYGTCEVQLRPCSQQCFNERRGSTFWGGPPWATGHYQNGGGWVPVLIAGLWYNIGCGCTSNCTCAIDGTKSLVLPGPIDEVVEVRMNGIILPEDEYEVTYNRFITLLKDDAKWPACQDLNKPDTADGTYSIRYTKGLPVPAGGQIAAGVLANELAKILCNDNTCALPQRLQTITRQGVTIGFQDLFEGLDNGMTGIWIIDSWISSVTRPVALAGVRSVDVPKPSVGSFPWL